MMTIENSKKLIQDYTHLLGENYKNQRLEVLLVTPRNDPEFSAAINQYIKSLDSSLIYPAATPNGYTVTAVLDLRRFRTTGVFFHAEFFSVLEKKGIVLDYSNYGI